jgi:CheY-like chemotaxis protein
MKHSPLVILFADKNPQFGRRLRGELRDRGARVLLAGSSDEAIHQAALASPDIVVMDDDLKSDGQVELGTFVHDAFPKAGIILLRGSPRRRRSASGLDLLLWGPQAHR